MQRIENTIDAGGYLALKWLLQLSQGRWGYKVKAEEAKAFFALSTLFAIPPFLGSIFHVLTVGKMDEGIISAATTSPLLLASLAACMLFLVSRYTRPRLGLRDIPVITPDDGEDYRDVVLGRYRKV